MTVYQEKPNIVKVVLSDDGGEAERFLVGQSLEDAVTAVENLFFGEPTKTVTKQRKPRRTKAEMQTQKVVAEAQATVKPRKTEEKEKAWS